MTTTILLSREHLASLASVGYAASTDDVTPTIQTVQITTASNELTAIATDRYVVAEITFEPLSIEGYDTEILIHAPFLLKAAKSFPAKRGQSAPIRITISDEDELGREIEITDYDQSMTSREVKGNYPPVARLFPAELPSDVTFTGWSLSPAKIAQLAKVIPPTATLREIKDEALTFKPTGDDEATGRKHAIQVTRGRHTSLRMLIQPATIYNY